MKQSNKMMSESSASQITCPIREYFKKYKQKISCAELQDIVNVDDGQLNGLVVATASNEDYVNGGSPAVYTAREKPGFYFIRRALSRAEQTDLIGQCLLQYPRLCSAQHSNLNIDGQELQQSVSLGLDSLVKEGEKTSQSTNKRRKCEHVQQPAAASKGQSGSTENILKKLRWLTMGIHYNWTTKQYDPIDANTRCLPTKLVELYSRIATLCKLDCVTEGTTGITSNSASHSATSESLHQTRQFSPDTAIVNFYREGDTISVHDDHSELCSAPLVSISAGLPALLLVGTANIEDSNVQCLLVRSGDCVVLSGEQRLAYHAVPRVFSLEAARDLLHEEDLSFLRGTHVDSDEKLAAFVNWSRINVSIRQAYDKDGQ